MSALLPADLSDPQGSAAGSSRRSVDDTTEHQKRPPLEIHPRPELLRTALSSMLAAMVPLFGALYWLGIPLGAGWNVLLLQIVILVLCAALALRQLKLFTRVEADALVGNGIFSPVERARLTDIASIHLVQTYTGQSQLSSTQLLVRDAAGRRIFRLRGTFWMPGDLERVAALLPVRPEVVGEPLTMGEFYRAYPGSAYWFEGRPVLTAILSTIAVAASIALGAGVMTLMGMPVSFVP